MMSKFLEKGYYLSIFLIMLPPISLFLPFLNIHSIAKLIWLFLFASIVWQRYRGQKSKEVKIDKTLMALFLIFFLSQSISIIPAFNISAFLGRYEDFLFSCVFFIVSIFFIDSRQVVKKIILILLTATFINIIFEFLIFFYPSFFLNFGSLFLHQQYLELIAINLGRKRIYLEAYSEAVIPIVAYFLIREKKQKVSLPLVFLVSLFSFLSNFRTRFLMLVFALTTSFLTLVGKQKRYLFLLITIPLFLGVLYLPLMQTTGFTVVERLFLEDKREDVLTVTGRLERWKKATEIGLSSPLFGVGLGNYYDYLDLSAKKRFSIFKEVAREFELASSHPHNIFFATFSETGFFGLLSLMALIFYFIRKDIKILAGKNYLSKSFALGFWTLFIYAVFNPGVTTVYQSLFWLFRVLEERS